MRPFRTLSTVLEMIKIEHTLFALPFAFLGMLLAASLRRQGLGSSSLRSAGSASHKDNGWSGSASSS
jgi:4-hydroxybenzoate polyprenyltransferase